MKERDSLKAALRDRIAEAQPDGTYDAATYEAVEAAIKALVPLNPIASPALEQARVSGPWGTLFAQFGAKHTAGKPVAHDSTLATQTFNKLPKVPVRVLSIDQEIDHEDRHYNNVVTVAPPDGGHEAHLIIWGRYDVSAETPQRYAIRFYAVELMPGAGRSAAQLRTDFGLDPEKPLRVDMSAPDLHSDIVYCDDDLRINYGSLGGIYVLERLHHKGHSVLFA